MLTQAREELIERSVQSLVGAKQATVHMYNAAAPVFRRVVFGFGADGGDGRAECRAVAVDGVQAIMKYADMYLPDTEFGLEYSPEIFMDTELDFSLEICEGVMDVWQPDADREIVVNLPCTVERSTPNIYADQIEWMSRHFSRREYVCLSVHTHNDRGTATADAELAVLAGAQRVEGCLFGNGERSGNVDLVTLGLNLYSQGIDPMIDFSDIDEIRRTVEYCNRIGVHERHPYVGDLVYTSFSGSHQDAIKKGFDDLEEQARRSGKDVGEMRWQIPYLPIDPKDVGRTYEAVIRVNSQSGKGGVAYIMKTEHKLDLPRRLQIEFSQVIQRHTDDEGGEVEADQMYEYFHDEYFAPGDFALKAWSTSSQNGVERIAATVTAFGADHDVVGVGNGPIDAFCNALSPIDLGLGGIGIRVLDYAEHALTSGGDAEAASYLELQVGQTGALGRGEVRVDRRRVTARRDQRDEQVCATPMIMHGPSPGRRSVHDHPWLRGSGSGGPGSTRAVGAAGDIGVTDSGQSAPSAPGATGDAAARPVRRRRLAAPTSSAASSSSPASAAAAPRITGADRQRGVAWVAWPPASRSGVPSRAAVGGAAPRAEWASASARVRNGAAAAETGFGSCTGRSAVTARPTSSRP